jgi:hypothetical protein
MVKYSLSQDGRAGESDPHEYGDSARQQRRPGGERVCNSRQDSRSWDALEGANGQHVVARVGIPRKMGTIQARRDASGLRGGHIYAGAHGTTMSSERTGSDTGSGDQAASPRGGACECECKCKGQVAADAKRLREVTESGRG